MGKTVVIIPSFNIAPVIGSTTKSVLNTGIVDEVLVVDDGSKDETARVALENGARVIRHSEKQGRSKAITSGLANIKDSNTSIVAFIQGDLGSAAGEMKRVIASVADGEADMCIAGFRGDKRFSDNEPLAKFGVKVLAQNNLKWPLSPDRAMNMERLRAIKNLSSGYGMELGLTIDWLREGFSIEEVEIDLLRFSPDEKDSLKQSPLKVFDMAKAIIPRFMRRHPGRKKTRR